MRVEPVGDRLRRLMRREHERDIVESAFHVERRRQRSLLDPEDAEPRVVRHELARPDAVDVFGRRDNANDRQLPPSAVDHGRHQGAGLQVVAIGERR